MLRETLRLAERPAAAAPLVPSITAEESGAITAHFGAALAGAAATPATAGRAKLSGVNGAAVARSAMAASAGTVPVEEG